MTQLPFREGNRFGILFGIEKAFQLVEQLQALHDFEKVAYRYAVATLFQ